MHHGNWLEKQAHLKGYAISQLMMPHCEITHADH